MVTYATAFGVLLGVYAAIGVIVMACDLPPRSVVSGVNVRGLFHALLVGALWPVFALEEWLDA